MKKLIVIITSVLLSVMANSAVATGKGNPWKKSACPCDFASTGLWAGWDGPFCDSFTDAFGSDFLSLQSTDTNQLPKAEVAIDSISEYYCRVVTDNSDEVEFFPLSDEEGAACEEDLNQLAILLGLLSGCAWP